MNCSVLQCDVVCGSVLQRAATWQRRRVTPFGIILQCVGVCCSILQCVVVCCSVWQCVAVCRRLSPCAAACGSVAAAVNDALWYSVAVFCSVLQCGATCCSGMQRTAVQSWEKKWWQVHTWGSGSENECAPHFLHSCSYPPPSSPHCDTLQHAAACNTLQHIAAYCNTLLAPPTPSHPRLPPWWGSGRVGHGYECGYWCRSACNTRAYTHIQTRTLPSNLDTATHPTATDCNALTHTQTNAHTHTAIKLDHYRTPQCNTLQRTPLPKPSFPRKMANFLEMSSRNFVI